MKGKKLLALSLGVMMLGSAGLAAGCSKERAGVSDDAGTINVAWHVSGYGEGFIREVAEAFNKLYKEQGYKVNLLDPDSTLYGRTALAEMRLGMATGVDVYLPGTVRIEDVLDPEYGICVEDLNDLYTKPYINFDGTEGTEPLANSLKDTNGKAYIMDREKENYYGFGHVLSTRGVVCNMKVLKNYGITEAPRTTDELFDAYDAIYYGANGRGGSAETGVFPTTWGGQNAYGYAMNSSYTHLAQMLGSEAYDAFYKMDNLVQDGTVSADSWKMYENEAIKDVLEVFIQQYDTAYSVRGAVGQDHHKAHSQIITGKAAFMTDGEFFLNEVRANFSQYLNDVTFVNIPVMTKLGVNLKLDGTGLDREKCDDILSAIVKGIDEGKDNATIKSEVDAAFSITLNEETQVERIRDARGCAFSTGTGSGYYITKGTQKKEICELFFRMLASPDSAKVLSKYGMLSAYSFIDASEYQYQFTRDAATIVKNFTYGVTGTPYNGTLRNKTNLFLFPGYSATMPVTIATEIGVVSDPATRDYAALAQTAYSTVTGDAQKNWKTYMERAGYTL